MALIAPSILSADFARLGEEVRQVAQAGADWIHLDVMDGHFVPNITFGPVVVEAIRPYTELPFDVHLMIDRPERYIEDFKKAGADIITVQAEACPHLHLVLQQIRQAGCRAGVALNPHTPLEAIHHVLDELDMVLIMSVNPGFGGQKFIDGAVPKIQALKRLIDQQGRKILIQVDGGINDDTVGKVARAGCEVFVAGTAIFNNKINNNQKKTYAQAMADLRRLIDESLKEQE
jgi:ribulose-phosphate 3-epimerase